MRVVFLCTAFALFACSHAGGSKPGANQSDSVEPADGDPRDSGEPTGGDDGSDDAVEGCDVRVTEDGGAVIDDGTWHASVQQAIDASAPGGEIVVCPGTHHVSLVVAHSLTLTSEGDARLVGDGSGPVVTATAGVLSLDQLALSGGAGWRSTPYEGAEALERGAGVYAADAAALTVTGCSFSDMAAGSAVGLLGPVVGDLVVEDTSFTNLRSTDGSAVLSAHGRSARLVRIEVVDNAGEVSRDTAPTVLLRTELAEVEGGRFAGNGGVMRGGEVWTKGGGLTIESDEAALRGVTFEDNVAGEGGGLWVSARTISLQDLVFRRNVAAEGDGGGLAVSFAPEGEAQRVTVDSVVLEDNVARRGGGGASLWVGRGSTVAVRDLDVSGNQAEFGGGVFGHGEAADDCELSLDRVRAAGNTAETGGGVLVMFFSLAELVDSELVGNHGVGGGLFVEYTTELALSRAVLQDNTSGGPGGGAATSKVDVITVTETELTGNVAAGDGGGWHAWELFERVAPSLAFHDTVFANNTAVLDGGGLYLSERDAMLTGATVIGNTAGGRGGGVSVDRGAFSAEATDWGSGETDNAPHDLATAAEVVESVTGSVACNAEGACGSSRFKRRRDAHRSNWGRK